jgi:hypothetical protein
MELLGKLAGVEIADRARVDFAWIDLRIVDCFPAGFRNHVTDRFAFLLQVALKIGSATAEDVNWFFHTIVTINLNARVCHPSWEWFAVYRFVLRVCSAENSPAF